MHSLQQEKERLDPIIAYGIKRRQFHSVLLINVLFGQGENILSQQFETA